MTGWNDWAVRRAETLEALGFFTRLPFLARPLEPRDGAPAEASWAFPLAGAVVGLCGAVIYAIAAALSQPPLLAGLLAVAATALITGGMHEDGVANTIERLVGRGDVADRLRDGRHGTFGILGIVLSIGLRAAALAAVGTVHGAGAIAGVLIAANALGRGLLPGVLRWLSPVGTGDFGAGRPEARNVAAAAGIALVIAVLGMGFKAGIVALLVAAAAVALTAWAAQRRIGGHDADALGAMEQAGEIAALLVAAAWT